MPVGKSNGRKLICVDSLNGTLVMMAMPVGKSHGRKSPAGDKAACHDHKKMVHTPLDLWICGEQMKVPKEDTMSTASSCYPMLPVLFSIGHHP